MLVEQIMRSPVISVTPGSTILEALTVIREKRIRHLPVMESGKLVGIVSDRNLRDVKPSILSRENEEILTKTLVGDIMVRDVITAHPLDPIEDAARTIYEHKIGCLPVLQQGKLVGIVSESDLLRSLVELTGVLKPGSHLEIEVPDKPGALAEIAEIIRDLGINIISVFVTPQQDNPDVIILVLRVSTMNPLKLIKNLKDAGYNVLWPSAEVHP